MQPSKYKPQVPGDFIGHTGKVASILFGKVVRLEQEPQAVKWLFYGPPGVGKSALAEVLALAIAEHSLGVERINGQSLNVEVVRSWEERLCYRPMPGWGKRQVKWIDELDLASIVAQNELLTYLDNLRDWMAVIATTNETLDALQPRLQSRFLPWQFLAVKDETIAKWLTEKWGVKQGAALAKMARGDVRRALNNAENVLDIEAVQ